MKAVFLCEGCRGWQISPDEIWYCPGCGKECCETCFDRFAHCKACSKDKTDFELYQNANNNGWDFDPPEGTTDAAP